MYSLKLFLLFHVLITASSILWGKRNISGESSVKSKAPIEELNIGLTESFVPESYYINRAISSISLNSGSTEFTEYEEVHLPDTPIDSKNIGVSTLLIAQIHNNMRLSKEPGRSNQKRGNIIIKIFFNIFQYCHKRKRDSD
jgi:hypothetical protein